MPHRIEIRAAQPDDAPDLARILVEANAATFRGLVPEQRLDFPVAESERNWRRTLEKGFDDGQFLVVATGEAKQLLGYALAGGATDRDAYPRELNVLMVDTPWQGMGIGRKLVACIAKTLFAQGVRSLLVGVQIDNPNRAFYEHLGARQIGEKPLDWEGYMTTEILYGWDDLTQLWDDDA